MNQQNEPYAQESDEIDLRPIIRKLWAGKWIILGMVAASLVAGAVYYNTATRWYQASVVLLPRDTKGSGGAGGQLAQLGGLASLAGISLGAPVREEPLAILRSKGFARKFIEEHGVDREIFAKQWDRAAGKWKADAEPKDHDIRDAVDIFQKSVLIVSEDKKTGLVTLAATWKDARLAAIWANQFAQEINDEMRAKALAESQATINYLTGEMEKSTVLALREAQGRLLENELQKLTLARGTREYAYRVIDQAYAPKKHTKPALMMVAVLATFFGGIFGLLVVFRQGIADFLSMDLSETNS